jgi:hypothetical protein
MYSFGNSVTEVVSHWLLIVEVQVKFQGNPHTRIICDGVALKQLFLSTSDFTFQLPFQTIQKTNSVA